MRSSPVVYGVLLLTSALLITTSTVAMAAKGGRDRPELEILNFEEPSLLGVAAASTSVNTTFFWWDNPYTWWPPKVCLWDYWTTAAWQLTFSGTQGIQCSVATGRALANLGRQGVITNRAIRSWLSGRIGGVTTSSVLCAKFGGTQVVYTIQLKAPRNTILALRQASAETTMNRIFTQATTSRTLSGTSLLQRNKDCFPDTDLLDGAHSAPSPLNAFLQGDLHAATRSLGCSPRPSLAGHVHTLCMKLLIA
jgi:hypothetical protein